MDCRETQARLTAFHDGELPAAERARMEEHLRGCRECGAALADLGRVDQAVGVPDPGPGYWARFNARVMDRVEREADGPRVAILRPKHGWLRQQLRYLVPAAAAAALVVMVVRYGGENPGAPTPASTPAVTGPAAPDSSGERRAKVEPESRAAKKAESAPVARDAGPPVLANERFAAVTREERDRLADRSMPAGTDEASRDRAAAPAAAGVPPSPPPMTSRGAPAGSPQGIAPDGMPPEMQTGRKERTGEVARMPERQVTAKAESASGKMMAKEAGDASPCERARTLAARERWRDAEAAQRACLSQDRSAPTQEKGLVFLAELLDRQERFAEADAVITEVDRRFPQSRPLYVYRQQRPMVQKQPTPTPVPR
jgi:hypothetical protein